MEHGFAYPGQHNPRITRHFDRSARDTLPGILSQLGSEMTRDGRSLLVHVEGSRALSCRPRVQKMSGTFVELALRVGCAIVPVRFTGGLPVARLDERAEFPVHMGRQDLYFGHPIAPGELERLNYRERTERVLDAINGLGPANELEQPLAPDPKFEASVRSWMDQTGASLGHATLFRLIEQLAKPCPELAVLRQAARDGCLELPGTPAGRWPARAGAAPVRPCRPRRAGDGALRLPRRCAPAPECQPPSASEATRLLRAKAKSAGEISVDATSCSFLCRVLYGAALWSRHSKRAWT
jgi:hypothetical protein